MRVSRYGAILTAFVLILTLVRPAIGPAVAQDASPVVVDQPVATDVPVTQEPETAPAEIPDTATGTTEPSATAEPTSTAAPTFEAAAGTASYAFDQPTYDVPADGSLISTLTITFTGAPRIAR